MVLKCVPWHLVVLHLFIFPETKLASQQGWVDSKTNSSFSQSESSSLGWQLGPLIRRNAAYRWGETQDG